MGLNHLRSTSPPEQLVVHDLLAPHSRALTHVLEHDRHLCSGQSTIVTFAAGTEEHAKGSAK